MMASEQLWDYPGVFAIPVTAASADIDAYGHVNNVVFLRWLTECAWAHSAAVGLPEERCVQLRRGMAVRSVHVDFLASAYEGEAVVGRQLGVKQRPLACHAAIPDYQPGDQRNPAARPPGLCLCQPRQRSPNTNAGRVCR